MEQQLKEGLAELNLPIQHEQITAWLDFYALLQKWNRVYNLTSIDSPTDVINKHFLDSLSVANYLKNANDILDVGTGAGFPGIPLAIYYPHKSFVLLDSNRKKIHFLNQVVASLGLKNISVIAGRFETFHSEKQFDVIISRAFSSLNDMMQHAWRLLKQNGQLMAMKGECALEKLPQGYSAQVVELKVPGTRARHLVIIERG